MKNIHKKFPGVYALNSVDFELKAGEVHALLGENGAGKSTLIKVLGGIYHPDQGQIIIDGKEVKINTVMDADAAGVSIIHQEIMTVPEMTIAENIFLGREPKTKFGTVDFKKMLSVSQELIDGFGLEMKASRKILALSIAQQQMVAIVKAISINAKIVVMDEPTSSLTDSEVDYLFEIIEKLKAQGIGIVYISHKLDELFRICDRITVMRDGQYVGTKVTAETTRDELISMMVGRTLDNYYVRTFHELGDVVLEAKNVKGGLVKDASFQLRKGEILGFAGLVGSGRSELMKDMIGLDPREGGEVFVDGKKVEFHGVTDAQREGLVLVPENRKKEGLLLKNSVGFNLTLAVLGDFIKGISVKKSKETEIINTYVDAMAIKTPSVNQLVGNLSGGNQQKVLIGKWLAAAPKILIMDEPTRGVDVGAKAEIYQIMNNLADQGVSIIMISSELPEVLGMCDRICVMYEGEITGVVDRKDFSQERVMHFATGGR
ncbi:sugar ABC transporter ATP-binding protein [Oscillospiraceae bacterium NSJ-54]|uniref:Sugar ABC transporter ATP-binding protein n=2 Tax=Zongyangia hominis TaxID=2763677 RepID=A0A926IAQ4_9FIRM|nr:sugar ABC transporter ATP-binding protein [Zongyangia hominis]MBC8570451.1 sugar ABC transporter ATP-binding protein [Zongyangia hominis]